MSRRVSYSCDGNDKPTLIFDNKHGSGGTRVIGSKKKVVGIWSLRLQRNSAVRFLNCIGSKVASALRFVSTTRSSRKVSSSSTLLRSRSYAEQLDSHRAEALEDCIEFLNSSSSLQRSNSVSTNFWYKVLLGKWLLNVYEKNRSICSDRFIDYKKMFSCFVYEFAYEWNIFLWLPFLIPPLNENYISSMNHTFAEVW